MSATHQMRRNNSASLAQLTVSALQHCAVPADAGYEPLHAYMAGLLDGGSMASAATALVLHVCAVMQSVCLFVNPLTSSCV